MRAAHDAAAARARGERARLPLRPLRRADGARHRGASLHRGRPGEEEWMVFINHVYGIWMACFYQS